MNEQLQKFCTLLALVEHCYLVGQQPMELDSQKKLGLGLDDQHFKEYVQIYPQTLVTDVETRNFLRPFCTHEFEQY